MLRPAELGVGVIVGKKFIIATPTKCGTYSWEAFGRRTPGLEVIRPLHNMVVPAQHAGKDRYLAVRDPYERLISVWTFIFYSPNRAQWGHRDMDEPTLLQFLRWFKDRKEEADAEQWIQGRSPWVYTKSLTQNLHVLRRNDLAHQATWPLHLEEADEEMEHLIDNYGLSRARKEGAGMYKQNTNKKWRPSYKWSDTALGLAAEIWCEEDCFTFGYDLR